MGSVVEVRDAGKAAVSPSEDLI